LSGKAILMLNTRNNLTAVVFTALSQIWYAAEELNPAVSGVNRVHLPICQQHIETYGTVGLTFRRTDYRETSLRLPKLTPV